MFAVRAGRLRRPALRLLPVTGCASPAHPAAGSRTCAAPAASTPADPAAAPAPGGSRWQAALTAAGAAAAAGLGYWALVASSVQEVNINLRQVSEEIFDTSDNLFVFFLDKAEDLLDRKEDIERAVRTLMKEPLLHRVTFYYNVRKDDDPPVPEGTGAEEENADGPPPIRCLIYKGQRKTVIRLGSEVPVKKITEFFAALSEDLSEADKKLDVPRVSNASFHEDVVRGSTPGRPVLLQMFEDTCFLCFLMRPFVNSLAKLFQEHGVPLQFKRLNIEKNDFPDGCPVARGTPTFAIFRGDKVAGAKWEEFKPKDLVERISKEYPNLPDKVFEQMDELQVLVSRRFQLFTQLVMWNVELQKLEALLSSSPGPEVQPASGGGDEDTAFSAVVSDMMAKDMKRTDLIADNLEHLQKEIDEVEHDAALMGVMLAQSVQKREQEEEEAWKQKRDKAAGNR